MDAVDLKTPVGMAGEYFLYLRSNAHLLTRHIKKTASMATATAISLGLASLTRRLLWLPQLVQLHQLRLWFLLLIYQLVRRLAWTLWCRLPISFRHLH